MYEFTKDEMQAHARYRKSLITAPYQSTIDRQSATIFHQNDTISQQQEFIISPVRKHLAEDISNELSRNIIKHINNALKLTHAARMDETVSINILASDLRMKIPSEMEGQLINKYLYKLKSNLNFGVLKKPSMKGYVTVYRFDIPNLSIEVEKS